MESYLKILVYAKSSLGKKKLLYKKCDRIHIFAYSDSGYAGDDDDKMSIIGYLTFVGGNIVTWRSKKTKQNKRQNIVSQLSARVEYQDMASCLSPQIRKIFYIALALDVWFLFLTFPNYNADCNIPKLRGTTCISLFDSDRTE